MAYNFVCEFVGVIQNVTVCSWKIEIKIIKGLSGATAGRATVRRLDKYFQVLLPLSSHKVSSAATFDIAAVISIAPYTIYAEK
jgi:hypothetical protein